MRGELILHVVHIEGKRTIEAEIDRLLRENNLGGMMIGVSPLKFVLFDEGGVERSPELEDWLISWWGDSIKKMQPSDWFEMEGDNIFLGTGASCIRDCDGVNMGNFFSVSVSFQRDSSLLPNDSFMKEIDGEGGGHVVYCY